MVTIFKQQKLKRYITKICDSLVQSKVLTSYIFDYDVLILFSDIGHKLIRFDYTKKYKVMVCEIILMISHIRYEQSIKEYNNAKARKRKTKKTV